jgi:hypothetical protein
MQFIFDSPDPAAARFRDIAEQRVRFVMRRHAWAVHCARVRLTDMNGPRGGLDKCCRLILKTDCDGTLHITSAADDWRAALDGALARAAPLLVRKRQRNREQRRQLPQRSPGIGGEETPVQ